MTATDELRRMLDDRGVEWSCPSGLNSSYADKLTFIGNVAVIGEIDGSDLLRINFDGTPEQAIEATLGRGTCKVDTEESLFLDIQRWHICGCCGTGFSLWYYTEDGDECEETPHYCPNCGRKVSE